VALEHLEEALRISEKRLGHEHTQVATTLFNKAHVYTLQGKHSEALGCLREALRIREKMLGDDHPDVGSMYQKIGLSHTELGEYEEAHRHLEKALDTFRKAKCGESEGVVEVQYSMAYLYKLQGLDTKAKELSGAAAKIYARVLGPEHSRTLAALRLSR